jgi:menaquinone-dependent protoporphyrinogen oxidase
VHRNTAALLGRPTWLFSSGPIGDQKRMDPVELDSLEAAAGFREHRLFGGALNSDQMSFGERLLAKAMKVSGDNREWPAIEAWADQIRTELTNAPTRSQV